MNIVIKNATSSEIPHFCAMAEMAGRDPGINDAALLYQFDPEGFFMAMNQNEIVGSISAVRYGETFGFLGLHFVFPQYQHTPLAEKLLEVAMTQLSNRVVGINCTKEQTAYYRPYGFTSEHPMAMYEGVSDGTMTSQEQVVSPFQYPFELIHEVDQTGYPYDRRKLLPSWVSQKKSLLLAMGDGNSYSSYGIFMTTHHGIKISSLTARNYESAERLLKSLTGYLPAGTRYTLEVPEENRDAIQLVESFKMKSTKTYVRMYTPPDIPVSFKNIYASTHYELG